MTACSAIFGKKVFFSGSDATPTILKFENYVFIHERWKLNGLQKSDDRFLTVEFQTSRKKITFLKKHYTNKNYKIMKKRTIDLHGLNLW